MMGGTPVATRVFSYQQAETARQLARRECKPLVVHFLPDSRVGVEQHDAFYSGPHGIARTVLDDVVIVLVPSESFAGFANDLGLRQPGGFRTLSSYDLAPFDEKAVVTCRAGFR